MMSLQDLSYKVNNLIYTGDHGEMRLPDTRIQRVTGHRPMVYPSKTYHEAIQSGRAQAIINHISNLLDYAQNVHKDCLIRQSGHQVTRLVMDEFSLYTKDYPLSMAEYRYIIQSIKQKLNVMAPNIHMLVATLPVDWTDYTNDPNNKEVHNCALYLQSSTTKNPRGKINHFAKKNASSSDYQYHSFSLKPDNYFHPTKSPAVMLKDSGVEINDINQFKSALKYETEFGAIGVICTGICLDHKNNVEEQDLNELLSRLANNKQAIPLHAEHLVSSASIHINDNHLSASVVHSDPNPLFCKGVKNMNPIGRLQYDMTDKTGKIPFGNCKQGTTLYPAKPIGWLGEKQLFWLLNNPQIKAELFQRLNATNLEGQTIVHRMILEKNHDPEITKKRLIQILNNDLLDLSQSNIEGNTCIDLMIAMHIIPQQYIYNAVGRYLLNCIQSNSFHHTSLTLQLIQRHGFLKKILETTNIYSIASHNQKNAALQAINMHMNRYNSKVNSFNHMQNIFNPGHFSTPHYPYALGNHHSSPLGTGAPPILYSHPPFLNNTIHSNPPLAMPSPHSTHFGKVSMYVRCNNGMNQKDLILEFDSLNSRNQFLNEISKHLPPVSLLLPFDSHQATKHYVVIKPSKGPGTEGMYIDKRGNIAVNFGQHAKGIQACIAFCNLLGIKNNHRIYSTKGNLHLGLSAHSSEKLQVPNRAAPLMLK